MLAHRLELGRGRGWARSNDLHVDYSATGPTTHLAARMEQLAAPGTIQLTADTLRLAEGYVEVKSLGLVPVKGLETPIEVYDLVGADPQGSRLHASSGRGLTHFVGRDREVDALAKGLARVAAGHGQVVALVGEPRCRKVAPGLGGELLVPRRRLAGSPRTLGILSIIPSVSFPVKVFCWLGW